MDGCGYRITFEPHLRETVPLGWFRATGTATKRILTQPGAWGRVARNHSSAQKEQKKIKMNVEVLISAPFSLLIEYPDENEDVFIENPNFSNIKNLLQIDLNTIQWANECYDILAGKRDLQRVKLFYSKCKKNYILLDNYFDPYDQLDTISIGIKGGESVTEKLRNLTRSLFDDCEYKISYREGNGQIFMQYPIDESSKKRWLELPSDKYIKGKTIEIV